MNKSIVIGKDVDAKKGFSSARRNDKSIHRIRDESERQLGSLGAVIGNIRRDGGTPSADGIATQLSSMHTGERAPALLALQQTHGNRYVQRVVAGIQAKLVVGQPGDKYEQEADRVADAVMRMPEPQVQRQPEEEEEEELIQTKPLAEEITQRVQRQVEPEEEEEEEIQTKQLPSQTHEIVPDVETRINSIRGGGQPLPESARAFFEPRFKHDFSRVRVHTDAKAADTARAVNARAFTRGHDVVFGAGQYAPGTMAGQRLMAHELTHVVQQRAGKGRVTQIRCNGESSDTSETYGVHSSTKTVSGRENQIKSSASPETIQLSPLSDELEGIWGTGDKGAFFDRLRSIRVSDTDVHDFVEMTLNGDDLWLARNILNYGPEASWPIHLRVEREMKGWDDCGDKDVVFDILRTANGSEVGNADLTNSLEQVFVAGSDDLWLARNILNYGPEASWPIHLRVEREMKGWDDCGDKDVVFDILRTANGSEVGNADLTNSLEQVFVAGSDDLWLARNLQAHGIEASWPIHLRVEREMKGWGDCGGNGVVFDILRTANGSEAGNADLINSIRNVFAAGTQDRWLAPVLQAYGPETSWPAHLTNLWADIQSGTTPVPPMEVSGAELPFEDMPIPAQSLYNCYDYAMGETGAFRQPGGGVGAANWNRAGILALMTSDLGLPVNCDPACPSATRKMMMFVTDDAMPGGRPITRIETQPTSIIYWHWDFHFYRQDIGGIWSHKPGGSRHRLTDILVGGDRISDPRTASRRSREPTGAPPIGGRTVYRGIDYTHLIGCWCVPRGTR